MTTLVQHNSHSPDSSEEIDSHQDTPATKISPFSPEEHRGQLKPVGNGFSRSKLPPQFLLHSPNRGLASSVSIRPSDPFVSGPNLSGTTQASSDVSKLSPNASAFTPTTLIGSGSGDAAIRSLKGMLSTPAAQEGVQGMIPGVFTLIAMTKNGTVVQQYALAGAPSPNGPFFRMGLFSSEGGTSRCVVIGQLAGAPSAKEINELFNVSQNL